MPKDYFDYLRKNGRVTKLRYIKDPTPPLLTNAYNNDTPHTRLTDDTTRELSYRLKMKSAGFNYITELMQDFIRGEQGLKNIAEEENFDYDKIKIEVMIGGHQRTITLDEREKLQTAIDITNKITTNDGGHPEFKSIDLQATKLLDDLRKDIHQTD